MAFYVGLIVSSPWENHSSVVPSGDDAAEAGGMIRQQTHENTYSPSG